MTPDQENVDRLRRLLALKRHEQPPPGYFHHFSQQVILRIKDGETGESATLFARWFGDWPWLNRLLSSFEARPAFGGVVGVAVCGLMVAGILYAEPEGSPMVVTGAPMSGLHLNLAPVSAYPPPAMFSDFPSTNGVRHLRDSLFDRIPRPPANSLTPVAY